MFGDDELFKCPFLIKNVSKSALKTFVGQTRPYMEHFKNRVTADILSVVNDVNKKVNR